MGCSSSKVSTVGPGIDPDAPWDPIAAAEGTWLDPTRSTAYDKVFVRLVVAEDASYPVGTVAAVAAGGCGKASRFAFGVNNVARMCMLVHLRSAGCSELTLTPKGGADFAVPIPPGNSDTWVAHTGLLGEGVTLEVRSQSWEKDFGGVTLDERGFPVETMDIHPIEITNCQPREKATLVYKTKPGNSKMLLWFPGRNDMWSHVHVLQPILDAGFDLYAVEHRKQGRSQFGSTAGDFSITAHVSDHRLVLEEQNAGFAFALANKPYEKVVLYGHSTGGLEVSNFLREGDERARISACVLNSPFLDWGAMSGLNELILDGMDELFPVISLFKGAAEQAQLMPLGGLPTEPSAFTARLWLQYPSIDLRARNAQTNVVTAGWAAASSEMHEELLAMTPTAIPTLLMHSDGDVALDSTEMPKLAGNLSTNLTCKFVPNCRHDMLMSYFAEDNAAVLGCMLKFMEKECGAVSQVMKI
jgi:alpha-beta hydrolase superfamily lysophospholipase